MARRLNLTKDQGRLTRTLLDSDHVIIMDYADYMRCILEQPIADDFRLWVEQHLQMLPTIMCEQFADRADVDQYLLDIKIIAGLKPKIED